MSRVLGNDNHPRIPTALPRAAIAYAILCIVAAVFVIASAFLSG